MPIFEVKISYLDEDSVRREDVITQTAGTKGLAKGRVLDTCDDDDGKYDVQVLTVNEIPC